MKPFWKDFIVLMIIIGISFWGIKAFAIPGLYTSHDGETHTARLANYYLAIKEGQLPPKLAPTLFGGYGFPIFIFIYPIPYALGALFHYTGISYSDATELVMAVGYVFSGIFLYQFLKLETKSRWAALVGTVFFVIAPYRFLMLFVRGAFAESFAYVFFSSSLLSLYYLFKNPHFKSMTILGVSLAGLLLSHQLTSVMFLPILVWYFVYKLLYTQEKRNTSLYALGGLILGFGLAAFIYIPAFFEREYLLFDSLINYWQEHFVSLRQLIRSPWSYGFSHQGTENDDMSFQIGLIHLLVVVLSVVTVLVTALTKRKQLLQDNKVVSLIWWLVPFSFSVLFMLNWPFVEVLWEVLPGLSFLDFPWRLLGVSITCASFLAAYLVLKFNRNKILIGVLLLLVLYANRNHLRINQSVSYDDAYFDNYPATATWRNEFLPVDRSTNKWENIEGEYQVINGEATVSANVVTTTKVDVNVEASTEAELMIHRMYFPGWQLSVDGETLTEPKQGFFHLVDGNYDLVRNADYTSFLIAELTPGDHHVVAEFKATPTRKVAYGITLISLGVTMLLLLLPIKPGTPRKSKK